MSINTQYILPKKKENEEKVSGSKALHIIPSIPKDKRFQKQIVLKPLRTLIVDKDTDSHGIYAFKEQKRKENNYRMFTKYYDDEFIFGFVSHSKIFEKKFDLFPFHSDFVFKKQKL